MLLLHPHLTSPVKGEGFKANPDAEHQGILFTRKMRLKNKKVYVMSDGVPTRQGRVARQIKVFFENPKRKPCRVIAYKHTEDLNLVSIRKLIDIRWIAGLSE